MTIRNCDTKWTFTDSIIEMLTMDGPHPTADALHRFKDGTLNNPMNYALGIRHPFAHGHLTAHSKGTDPADVKVMCDALSELMLGIVDEEFYRIVMPRYQDYVDKEVL